MFAATSRYAAKVMAAAVVPTTSFVTSSYYYINGNGARVDCEAVSETARLKIDAARPNLRKRVSLFKVSE